MTNFNPFVDAWPWWLKVGVIAGALGLEFLSMRFWGKLALDSDDGRATPQFMNMWPWIMRPGNLLILFGVALFVYDCLRHPPLGNYWPVHIAGWAMVLGFILRHWGWWTNAG